MIPVAEGVPGPAQTGKAIWDKKNVPHKGWTDTGVWDAAEDPSRDPEEVLKCEMCGQTRIRYMHLMTHPDYDGMLGVGGTCASKMVTPYAVMRESG